MSTTPPSPIGQRLAASRRRRGLSREELAVRSGLSWSAITQIETGRRPNPRADTVAALGAALGVTSDYLLGRARTDPSLLIHHSLVYEDRDAFVAAAGPMVGEGVAAGDAALVVTTPENIEGMREHLGADAARVRFAESANWYTSPRDAFGAYRDFADRALDAGAAWLRIIGEPVWAGRSDDEITSWARYESLLNLAFANVPLTLACPYDASRLEPRILEHALATHCTNLGPGQAAGNVGYRDPAEFCLGDGPS